MIIRRDYPFPTWGLRSHFEELERMRKEMDRLFENLSGRYHRPVGAGVFPLLNLTEDRDKYFVRAELPGLSSDDLKISLVGNSLSISGERKIAAEGNNVRYHRREREAGSFSRVINLPGEVDSNRVEASLKDGILMVAVAKAEKAKPRQITIN